MKNTEKSTHFLLNAQAIDSISAAVRESLAAEKMDKKEALRISLSVEEILLTWRDALGEETDCSLSSGKRMGRPYIQLSAPGRMVNPYAGGEADGTDDMSLAGQNILAGLGLAPSYIYSGGANQIVLMPKKKERNPIFGLLIAIVTAVLLGALALFLPETARSFVSGSILSPLVSTFLGALSAIAGPMMLLSVIWGIYSIGDVSSLGFIGKGMILRFMAVILILIAVFTPSLLPFFPFSEGASSGNISEVFNILLNMILDIIPSNLIAPFYENNSLQIVFMAAVIGVAMIILSKKTLVVAQFVEQCYDMVQLIMEGLSKIIPVFVFCSILNLLLSGSFGALASALKVFLIFGAALVVYLVVNLLLVSLKMRMNPVHLLRKVLPTFLIALTTASSAAAFATNVSDCQKKLGIHEKLVNLGIPLGTVLFKPSFVIEGLLLTFFSAQMYDVPITLAFVLMTAVLSGLMSMAAPPVPGGALTVFTLLFTQVGIPAEAVALAIAMDVLMDFPATAANLGSLQLNLVMLGNKLGMLDKDVLKNKSHEAERKIG